MEATVPKSDEPAHQDWEPMLLEVGYRFAMFDGLNRFYAHADEPAERLADRGYVERRTGWFSHDEPTTYAYRLTEQGDHALADS
jgi:hypothetical protein